MKLTEDNPHDGYFITAYDEQHIMVNGTAFHSSLVIAPDRLISEWSLTAVEDMDSGHMQAVAELEPELVIVGTGENLVFPDIAAYAQLINNGIGVETMDTGAACRTYNVLMAEGRRVVAALILPD